MVRTAAPTLPEPTRNFRAFTGADALIGSARKLDPLNPDDTRRERVRKLPWQPRAWQYYDEMGEVWFAHNYKANAIRKARLVIAQPSPNPDEEPETLKATDSNADVQQAYAELERMHGQSGSHAEILSSAALNISAVGEGYLTGWKPDGPDGEEEWDFLSTDQVEIRSDNWIIREGPLASQAIGYKLKPTDFIARIWRRHPRWRDVADCEMRAVLTVCDELLIAQRAMRATDVSRLAGNGILIVAQEASFGPINPAEVDEGDGQDDDPLTQDLIETMTVPIQDPDNAAATVPLLLRMPAELCDQNHVRHMTFARPHDDKALERINSKMQRLANGLDIPAEVILGLSKGNHWNAWLVDDTAFTYHIEPLLTMIVNGLTSAFLRPTLKSLGITTPLIVWYDATQIVKHPNQSQDAKDLHDRRVIGDAPLRAAAGFTEKDAPTPEDWQRWGYETGEPGEHDVTPGPGAAGTGGPSTDTGDARDRTAPGPPGGPNGERPTTGPNGSTDGGNDTPGYDDGTGTAARTVTFTRPAPTPLSVVAAAGRRPRADHLPLGSQLLEIDRATRYRIQSYADGAIQRALERAGAAVRRKVGNGPLKAAITEVDNALVAATLGEATVKSTLGFADDLLDTSFPDLQTRYLSWTAQAQRRTAEIAQRYDDSRDPEEYVDKHTGAREAGWAALATSLAAIAAGMLYNPVREIPPQGEYEAAVNVPVGTVRGSMSLAGGAVGEMLPDGTVMATDQEGNAVDPGMIATGVDALALLDALGVQQHGWVWVTGAPDRPFEPHQDLEGVEFTSWSDDALANDGDWPDVGHFCPGDHPGCACDVVPLLDDTQALPSEPDEPEEAGES